MRSHINRPEPAMRDELDVATSLGRLRGRRDPTGVLRFQGVPFAAAPIGDLRFRPPVAAPPWPGVRDATAPACDDARRPVLVYIHAGAFITGAGSAEPYSGVHLARDQDLVVVSINYRLGVLGFPPFKPFGDDTPQNLGLLDQVAALEWVRDNIAVFGGDPDCVTVCGYSAGGWSIAALMVMPPARNLFHRAAPQSGGFMYAMSAAGPARHSEAFAAALGDAAIDPARLMSASVEELLRAQAETIASWQAATGEEQVVELDFPFTPLADGVILHEHPIDTIAAGGACSGPV